MYLVKSTYRTILGVLFLLLAFSSCTDTSVPEPEENKIPMAWDVHTDADLQSRVLIDDNALRSACTPNEKGKCESIGIWGEFDYEYNGQTNSYIEFDAVPLTYAFKGESVNSYHNWSYPGSAHYWTHGAVYTFHACFPQKLMTSLMTDQMDATIFCGDIETSDIQEDILVAATNVDTRTANFNPVVPLNMKHIFAAIKFQVKAAEGYIPEDGEAVTSCWLQNSSNESNLFSTSGMLEHSANASSEIKWTPGKSSQIPMYKWVHNGVSFNSSTENTLYIPNDGFEGEIYTKNDAWLLIVPQTIKEGTLKFYYTLSNGGEQVFSVNIPAITYECGKKYTYLLKIRGAKVDLTIAPWNDLESNHDITI